MPSTSCSHHGHRRVNEFARYQQIHRRAAHTFTLLASASDAYLRSCFIATASTTNALSSLLTLFRSLCFGSGLSTTIPNAGLIFALCGPRHWREVKPARPVADPGLPHLRSMPCDRPKLRGLGNTQAGRVFAGLVLRVTNSDWRAVFFRRNSGRPGDLVILKCVPSRVMWICGRQQTPKANMATVLFASRSRIALETAAFCWLNLSASSPGGDSLSDDSSTSSCRVAKCVGRGWTRQYLHPRFW